MVDPERNHQGLRNQLIEPLRVPRSKDRFRRSSQSPQWNAELLRASGSVIKFELLNRTGQPYEKF